MVVAVVEGAIRVIIAVDKKSKCITFLQCEEQVSKVASIFYLNLLTS